MKKLQVFVSSTYLDLKSEREKAVEGILRAGHIPAGMELFTASSKSQWDIIEEWIKESDVLFLILGGKYGSIEPQSGKSYTQLEYEFALKNNIPVCSIVLNDQYLNNKKSADINLTVFEREVDNPQEEKYIAFKNMVLKNLVKFVNNVSEVAAEVSFSLQNFISKDGIDYNFRGWIRGTEHNDIKALVPQPTQSQNNGLFKLDEDLFKEIVHSIESNYFIGTIDSISANCSYDSDDSSKLSEFIHYYSKPSKKYINEDLQKLLDRLLSQLNKYTNHLAFNFFYKNNYYALYPELNSDYQSVTKEKSDLFNQELNKLIVVSEETKHIIEEYVHNSKIVLYKLV